MIELEPVLGWVNTARPLTLAGELRGQVVLLLFWDCGRVGCETAVAEAREVFARFRHEPVALVGVHDTRFTSAAGLAATRRRLERAGVTFPVAVDRSYAIWRKHVVRSSPTTLVIDPAGEIAARASGEGNAELLQRTVSRLLAAHRAAGTLATGRLASDRVEPVRSASGLWGPEKIVAQTPSIGRDGFLMIADTGQHRVIVADWPHAGGSARVRAVYGDGVPGLEDGTAGEARFRFPRGMAFEPERKLLYVADTGNHAIRVVDIVTGTVRTIVGRSARGHGTTGGASGTNQALHAPWDVSLDAKAGRLLIAMAATHQIWSAELDTMVTRAIVGSGKEDIIDGAALEAAFAQPSAVALSTDRRTLYCVDAEGSAVRAVELATRQVRTVAGGLRQGGVSPLDAFGNRDGETPLFARPLGLTVRSDPATGLDEILVADTGNNAIRAIDPASGRARTLEGVGPLDWPTDVSLAGALASRTEPPRLFVLDTHLDRILRQDEDGWTEIGLAGLGREGPSTERAVFNTPMHQELKMFVPGVAGLGPGEPACFRVASWTGGVEDRVVWQRTLTGSAAGREQSFVVPAELVDAGRTLLVHVTADGRVPHSWRVRFGSDGGEPRLRA